MSAVPVLHTLRLTLREWREGDIGPLEEMLADAEVTRYLFAGGAPLDERSVREAYGRRVSTWEDDGLGFWAVELHATGEFIGWAGLQVAHHQTGLEGAVEVGWTLGREWWGHGYAREAAEAALRYGFEERGIDRIYAFHAPANRRSERVMESLGMMPAGDTTDARDGSVSKLRLMTRRQWDLRGPESSIANPHRDPDMLANVIGYDVTQSSAVLSPLSADPLRDALLAAIVRTWPGPELPGEPKAYRLPDDGSDLAATMMTDRMAGLVPMLVTVEISSAEDAGERLEELYITTLREGVWLHADIVARHGMLLERLGRADSIAFDVPSQDGRVRLFATRHPGMLDDTFSQTLAGKG